MRERLNRILELLDSGEKTIKEISEALEVSDQTTRKSLNILRKDSKVVCVQRGLYDLHEDYRPLTLFENRKHVKDLIHFQRDTLVIHRRDLDILLAQSDPNPEEKQRLLDCIKTLALSIDRLLKRWNLLVQGYDSNTKQASEDAKQKTAQREKQAMEHLPPEKQLEVVGDYDVEMRGILESLPEPVQKELTV